MRSFEIHSATGKLIEPYRSLRKLTVQLDLVTGHVNAIRRLRSILLINRSSVSTNTLSTNSPSVDTLA